MHTSVFIVFLTLVVIVILLALNIFTYYYIEDFHFKIFRNITTVILALSFIALLVISFIFLRFNGNQRIINQGMEETLLDNDERRNDPNSFFSEEPLNGTPMNDNRRYNSAINRGVDPNFSRDVPPPGTGMRSPEDILLPPSESRYADAGSAREIIARELEFGDGEFEDLDTSYVVDEDDDFFDY